jgi:hypothetical protein
LMSRERKQSCRDNSRVMLSSGEMPLRYSRSSCLI